MGYSDSKYRTSIGRQIPGIVAANATDTLTAASLRGNGYTIINFWSATDAQSREAANLYTAWLRTHPEAPFRLVSINMDDNDALYNEIIDLDSLDVASQYYVRGDTARTIMDTYGLHHGFGSILVNNEGRIVAHNPTPEQLDKL